MGILYNFVGQDFGDLHVMERVHDPMRFNRILWRCKCKCGAIIWCTTNQLNRKNSPKRNCGDLKQHKRSMPNDPYRSERGKRYSRGTSKQKCWTCKKACGGYDCPWAHKDPEGYFPEPVPGWDADETKVLHLKGQYQQSFEIRDCPMYEKG